MSIFFNDTFTGSGTINGHVPDVGVSGVAWYNQLGATTLSSGYAVNAVTYNNATRIEYYYYGGGLPIEMRATIVWSSGAYVATPDANGHQGFTLTLATNDGGASFSLAADPGASLWHLAVDGMGATATTFVPAGQLLPNTDYTGVMTWSLAGVQLDMFGQTCYVAYDRTGTVEGLNNVRLLIGGTRKISSLLLDTDLPVAPTGITGLLSMPTLLGAPALLALNDFSGQLGDVTSVYVADLITPTGTWRVPVSSWQATLRTGGASYVQAVVPACAPWVAAINSATQMVISRRAVLPSGLALDYEMARTPLEQVQFDQGPQRYTCTISGYTDGFAEVANPDAAYDRTLTGIRSVSSNGSSGRRVRCSVDWLLRPGQRAWANGTPFVVGYINYYSPSGWDSYMDVGEQS